MPDDTVSIVVGEDAVHVRVWDSGDDGHVLRVTPRERPHGVPAGATATGVTNVLAGLLFAAFAAGSGSPTWAAVCLGISVFALAFGSLVLVASARATRALRRRERLQTGGTRLGSDALLGMLDPVDRIDAALPALRGTGVDIGGLRHATARGVAELADALRTREEIGERLEQVRTAARRPAAGRAELRRELAAVHTELRTRAVRTERSVEEITTQLDRMATLSEELVAQWQALCERRADEEHVRRVIHDAWSTVDRDAGPLPTGPDERAELVQALTALTELIDRHGRDLAPTDDG